MLSADAQTHLRGPSSSAVPMAEHLLEALSVLDVWLSSSHLWLNPVFEP